MKIYVFTDLEGATGVVDYDYGSYQRRMCDRNFLISDINTVIAASYDCGAEKVVICDGHGQDSIHLDKIDPRAVLIKRGRYESYLPGLDANFSHFMLVGFHSMAGTGGLLSHTHSRRVRRVVLNGQEIGEIGLSFMNAKYFGVSPFFISGDDTAVNEARTYFPGLAGVSVKQSISERCGFCLHPETTSALIYEGVLSALKMERPVPKDLPEPPLMVP